MVKAILLYNPASGNRQGRRMADVEAALAVVRSAGVEASKSPTGSSAEAAEQARDAVAAGCDTIFACGGDGTIHDVIQGMAGSQASLAIIPLGTANCLAHDLGLPWGPATAAKAALDARPRPIALGRAKYVDSQGVQTSRVFIVAAGVGVDAHLFYQLDSGLKKRLGMMAYYAKATHLWMTDGMPLFIADFLETGASEPKRALVSQLLAVRIRNFGGVLRELAPGASVERSDARLVLFRTRSRFAYLLYILRGLFGMRYRVPGIELAFGEKAACHYLPTPLPRNGSPRVNPRIYVELDGELVGTLPAEITVVPDALNLLAP
jgi:diacylglycerol kinase (ATP)